MAENMTYENEVEVTEEPKKGNSRKKLLTALGIGAAGVATAAIVSAIIKKKKANRQNTNEDDSCDEIECEEECECVD